MPDGMHDTDFHAWALRQAAILRRLAAARVNTPLDLEHLAEEIEDLGNSEVRAVESHLELATAHLLKLEFSPAEGPRDHWMEEVGNHRLDAAKGLRRGPSIRARLDLAEIYADARQRAAIGLARDGIGLDDLPAECPWTFDQILDPGWWPINRHGLGGPGGRFWPGSPRSVR